MDALSYYVTNKLAILGEVFNSQGIHLALPSFYAFFMHSWPLLLFIHSYMNLKCTSYMLLSVCVRACVRPLDEFTWRHRMRFPGGLCELCESFGWVTCQRRMRFPSGVCAFCETARWGCVASCVFYSCQMFFSALEVEHTLHLTPRSDIVMVHTVGMGAECCYATYIKKVGVRSQPTMIRWTIISDWNWSKNHSINI